MDIRKQLLTTLENLKPQWPQMFGEETGEVAHLVQSSHQIGDEQLVPVYDALVDLISRHPEAKEQLAIYFQANNRLFEVVPGSPGPVPPGPLMVCPIDPTHYRKRLRQKGQQFICPEHNVELVSEIMP